MPHELGYHPAVLMLGSTVGAYRVLSQLGAGGMGVVYKALDVRLQRHVALKVLPAAVSADQERRRRFLQEARAASALNDPHIITVYDIFEHNGTDFLVMEMVEGRTLRDAAADPLPIDRVVDYVAQIADALAVAHAAGIIHRDLKPGNIMVTNRGQVKVLDFGIAKFAVKAEDVTAAPMTTAGDVIGTSEYMSPEQARGGVVDQRTDVFSLGALLHELLAAGGRPTPLQLDAVTSRALQRDPAKRYQSMHEFASALRAWRVRGRSAFTRSRIVAIGIAAITVTLLAAWLGGLWRSGEQAPAVSRMPEAVAVAAPTTALEHTQYGLGLLHRFDQPGNVAKAISSFDAAIALDKNYAPGWSALARAYWRQHQQTRDTAVAVRAIDAARQAIALDSYLADAHVSLGLAQTVTGDSALAQEAFERALRLDPSHAAAFRGLGDLAEKQDRLDTAIDHYQKAISLAPDDWELPRLIGNIPYKSGNYVEALAWYEKAAAAAPQRAAPQVLIGATQHMLGNYAAAATAFQKSLVLQPTASGYTNLGTALFYQGLYRESLQAFERAVEMLPSNPLMWGNVADAYRWVPGNKTKADEAYARAVQLLQAQLATDPSNVPNRSRLALYLAKSGNTQAAQAELEKVLAADVQEVNTWYRGAVTHELAGNRSAALAALQTALERGYSLAEVRMDPELERLRTDVRYHRLASRFETTPRK